MHEEEQKEVQEKYMELQILGQQMKQLQQHAQQFEEQLTELAVLDQGLDDLKDTKTGTDILVPLSSGIFVKAELKDNNDLSVNVGNNTVVKKSLQDTKKLVKKQIEEIKRLQEESIVELQKLAMKAELKEKEINDIVSKIKI